MTACNKYIWFHCASFFGEKLGLFLIGSPFLLAGSSIRPTRSGTATYSLVAPLVSVLLKWIKWVATEPFRVWPKWHSTVAQKIGLNSGHQIGSDRTRTKQKFIFKLTLYNLQLFQASSLKLSILILVTALFVEEVDLYYWVHKLTINIAPSNIYRPVGK